MSEIRVDSITDEAGTGSPSLPNGLGVTGNIDVSGKLTNGGTAGIEIDNAGRIIQSNQPYFLAFGKPSGGGNSLVFGFDTVQYNNGNHYDNSSGKFTAPKSGVYFISATLCYDSGDGFMETRINGIDDLGAHAAEGNRLTTATITYITELTQNDFIQVFTQMNILSSTPRNHFSAYFLG